MKKGPWGTRPGLPLMGEVAELARALGRQVAGDDLFLLAITKLEDDLPARQALRQEGIDEARVIGEIQTSADVARDDLGVTYSAASYILHGRAEGIAMMAADGTITREHVLLALLWDPVSESSKLLWRLGVSRDRIVQRLAELGVTCPERPAAAAAGDRTGRARLVRQGPRPCRARRTAPPHPAGDELGVQL